MPKSKRKRTDASSVSNDTLLDIRGLGVGNKDVAVDPALASLFESSAGPVTAPSRSRYRSSVAQPSLDVGDEGTSSSSVDADEVDSGKETLEDEDPSWSGSDLDQNHDPTDATPSVVPATERPSITASRKRKRKDTDDEVEAKYMLRIVNEGAKEDREKKKSISFLRQDEHADNNSTPSVSTDEAIPQHESLAAAQDGDDVEKASRTVFLSNVSTLAITSKTAKKTLLDHLSSFFPLLQQQHKAGTKHKVESLRFRSTAFSSAAIPKKAAFAKKELMERTTKSTNAYAVYSSAVAAREAAKRLNGSVVLDRHLRVDSVAHPAQIDHRRCVFVGNLGFIDDMSAMDGADDNGEVRKKLKQPADVEEGLWRHFGNVGVVESVRVVRDAKTRVGKGFAYVQFLDGEAVEDALLYNEKKFPPLLPRKLRITRARKMQKPVSGANQDKHTLSRSNANPNKIYVSKTPSEVKSFHGRASKLLGRAGAAKVRSGAKVDSKGKPSIGGMAMRPEMVVFEGHRATGRAGKSGLKLGGSGKKKGKPRTRSSKRGSVWKAAGGKKS